MPNYSYTGGGGGKRQEDIWSSGGGNSKQFRKCGERGEDVNGLQHTAFNHSMRGIREDVSVDLPPRVQEVRDSTEERESLMLSPKGEEAK